MCVPKNTLHEANVRAFGACVERSEILLKKLSGSRRDVDSDNHRRQKSGDQEPKSWRKVPSVDAEGWQTASKPNSGRFSRNSQSRSNRSSRSEIEDNWRS